MQAMERVPRTSRARIRYTRERLLEFHDACTQLPEELQDSEVECLTVNALELRLRKRIEKDPRYATPDRFKVLPATAIVKATDAWMDCGGAQSMKKKVLCAVTVYRTVQGILNKLTLEKYDVLAEQMMQAGISSAQILQGVISLILDKAISEPGLSAKLCVQLSKELPEFPGEQAGDKPITFRRVLLNTCQKEFEGAAAMWEVTKKLRKPEQAVERDEQEKRVKLRTLGNISLICELFKQEMLPGKIMHACILELLGQDPKAIPAEENVEALCHLFTTVGKQLEESAKSKRAFNTYFARLRVIGESRALPSRIRFMVRNIQDMRSNKWVPRREEILAKAINEIHAEAEAKSGLPLEISETAMRNSSGSVKLEFTIVPDRSGSGGVGFCSRGGLGSPGRARFGSPAMHAGGMSARARPQGSACYGFMSSGSPKPVAPADLTKKSESLVKEYLSIVDLNEAVLCVQELKSPGFHAELVRVAMATALDMREKECSLVLKLLLHLHAKEVISTSDLKGGVLLVTERLEDMAMDAPLAPKGLGAMLAGLVLAGAVELQLMQEAALKLEDEFLQEDVIKAFVEKLKENEAEVGEVCGKASVDKEGLLSVAVASDLSKLLALRDCRAAFIARDNFGHKDDLNLKDLLHRVQMFGK